jgi:hypothetical protein
MERETEKLNPIRRNQKHWIVLKSTAFGHRLESRNFECFFGMEESERRHSCEVTKDNFRILIGGKLDGEVIEDNPAISDIERSVR